MTDPEKDAKNEAQAIALVSWFIGSLVIFVVASVSYFYFGVEGEVWFQFSGFMVALIIADYTLKMFRFVGKEEDNDLQE